MNDIYKKKKKAPQIIDSFINYAIVLCHVE